MSGFITSGFSVGADDKYGAIKMAIIGGTVSELGGGKFANGAMGSAFEYMFNDSVRKWKLSKAVKTLTDGLYGFGDYLGRLSGLRDLTDGLVVDQLTGGSYYQEEAIMETRAVATLAKYAITNPSLTINAITIYADYNEDQLIANSLINFYTGLAVPAIGVAAFVGNTMAGAHKINNIYESIRK